MECAGSVFAWICILFAVLKFLGDTKSKPPPFFIVTIILFFFFICISRITSGWPSTFRYAVSTRRMWWAIVDHSVVWHLKGRIIPTPKPLSVGATLFGRSFFYKLHLDLLLHRPRKSLIDPAEKRWAPKLVFAQSGFFQKPFLSHTAQFEKVRLRM